MTVMASADFARTVAVIGAGFTGSLFALKMARARPDWTILLIEPRGAPGRGLAYGACEPHHILNVPVSRMEVGLDPSFGDWLAERPALLRDALAESGGILNDAFVPRQLFGDYMQQRLEAALMLAGGVIRRVRGEVMAVSAQPRQILLDDGRNLTADMVVLATGNPPPAVPKPLSGIPQVVTDPWHAGALDDIAPTDAILMVGSGLTAVDVLLSLEARGHHGRIVLLSRHGLLPRAHRAGGTWRPVLKAGVSPRQSLRIVRAHVREALAAGVPWQRVFDAIRPAVASVWHAWTLRQRRQFLRHLRARWDVHRHRMAPRVAEVLEASLAEGRVEVLVGRLESISPDGDGFRVMIDRRGNGRHDTSVAKIINCTGPRTDIRQALHPLFTSLLRQGLAFADALGLGPESDDCAMRNAEGDALDWLYVLGPPTRSAWWEIVAVPEIRLQVDRLVARLARQNTMQQPLTATFMDIGAGI